MRAFNAKGQGSIVRVPNFLLADLAPMCRWRRSRRYPIKTYSVTVMKMKRPSLLRKAAEEEKTGRS